MDSSDVTLISDRNTEETALPSHSRWQRVWAAGKRFISSLFLPTLMGILLAMFAFWSVQFGTVLVSAWEIVSSRSFPLNVFFPTLFFGGVTAGVGGFALGFVAGLSVNAAAAIINLMELNKPANLGAENKQSFEPIVASIVQGLGAHVSPLVYVIAGSASMPIGIVVHLLDGTFNFATDNPKRSITIGCVGSVAATYWAWYFKRKERRELAAVSVGDANSKTSTLSFDADTAIGEKVRGHDVSEKV